MTSPVEPQNLRAVFAIPALLGSSTLTGLAAALLGSATVWRWIAWLLLGAPLAVIALRVAISSLRYGCRERDRNE